MSRRAWTCLLLGVLAAPGCREENAEPGVYALRVDDIEAPTRDTEALPKGWVRRTFDAALGEAPGLVPAGQGAQPELGTRLRFAELHDGKGTRVLRLEVAAESPPHHAGLDFQATVELERTDGSVEMKRDLPVATARAVAVLQAKLVLSRGEADAIARLLRDEDPELNLLALDWVARNRRRDMADQVATLLDHEDQRVVLRAVECVGLVGGPEHVGELVAKARLADRGHAGRLYEALASVGGDEARGFLEFAARNEDDPDLAVLAKRALERVDRAAFPETPPPARGHR